MVQPTFAQLKQLFSGGVPTVIPATGEVPETLTERLLTCLAIMASGQNPDGTAWAGGGGQSYQLTSTILSSTHSYTTASTTPVAVDSTNLSVSFTTAASGIGSTKVMVVLSGICTTTGTFTEFGLVNHGTTTVVPGSQMQDIGTSPTYVTCRIPITGLAPSTAFHWDWAWDNPAGSTSNLFCGGSGGVNGTLTMEVVGL